MGIIKKIIQPIVNNAKGKAGERQVNRKLNPILFGKVPHKQINNLTLIDENGKTHQIDHIEIRENGIFCIETKNYIGWIFGDEYQDKWVQTLYNGQKNYFTNPLKQNKSHIYHISRILGKGYRINSVVVMVQNNSEKINSNKVVDLVNLKLYLDNFDDGVRYTAEEMEVIYNKLLNANANISTREHVKNIKQTQKELEKGICPRCGGKLVERNGQYGKFWGCSNYPNCKFILKDK